MVTQCQINQGQRTRGGEVSNFNDFLFTVYTYGVYKKNTFF